MAYGVLYEFRRTSTNGADILITISQRDYEGEVKQRSLGRAPVIKRENNGHIYGTSCELYAECLIDGEFSQLYTSDAYEFRVEVYRNGSLLWMGFVSPELYSEPDVAPPYDVQIIATDGLGELKNFKFEKRGVASMLSHINYLMGKTGIGMALNIVSELRYVDDTGVASADKGVLDFKTNLDHEEGSTCYDVLQNLMSSINANITQYNGRYLIFRETDFINKTTEEGVEGFDVNGSAVSLPVASFGSMNQHKWWPVGQLSTVIEPAKNEVVLRAPDHYKDNVLDFDDWALANAASFNEKEGAYILPDEGSNISQYVDFDGVEVGYRLGLRVRARNVGITETDQNIGIQVEIKGRAWAESLGTQFWLRKSGGASTGHPLSDYAWNTKEDFVEEELHMPTDADTSADAQNIDIVIPLYDNANDVLGTFVYANDIKITIFNPAGIHDIYVYDVSLVKYEQIEGYEADVVISNAAREEEGEVELTMSAGDLAPAAGKVFMTGIPLLPSGFDTIKQWQVGDGNHQDYLSVMAYDYSRAIALPKMKYAGVLNVPGETVSVPLLFLRDGTYYFPKTYSFDIYDDELEIELISISAADVSLSSVIISQMAQSSGNMGGLTTSGFGGGGVVSLPRDKEMSDTSDNAVENRVIKAYVDGEVKSVADLLASMWYLDDDGNVRTKHNVVIEGDTSSGGEGEDTPSAGLDKEQLQAYLDEHRYVTEDDIAGLIPDVDLTGYATEEYVRNQLSPYATKTDVSTAIANLVNGAPTTLDTLKEIADALAENEDVVDALEAAIGTKANASDVYTKSQIDAEFEDYETSLATKAAKSDLTTLQGYFSNGIAKKATADASGNVITSYYTPIATHNALATRVGTAETDITNLTKNKADKATTLAGYGITNAYTKTEIDTKVTTINNSISGVSGRVTTLEAWKSDIAKYITIVDGNVKISTNLIVTGDTSSGGSGEDTGAEGTVTGVIVGTTKYESVSAGLLDLTSLMNLYTPVSTHNNLAGRVSALEGKATAVSFTQTLTSGTKIGTITIDGVAKNIYTPTIPTAVSAFTNDEGYLTGITKSMVDSVLGGTSSTNANKFLMCTGSTTVWSAITASTVGLGNVTNLAASGYLTALSSNTTNAVSITVGGTTKTITAATMKSSLGLGSNAYTSTAYLPLAGGTLGGELKINPSNGAGSFYVYNSDDTYCLTHIWDGNTARLYNITNDGQSYGVLNLQGTIQINGNTPITSGNIGSQSVNYATSAGNANTLGGYGLSSISYSRRVFEKSDYQHYVVLLCKVGTNTTGEFHRITGKIYTSNYGYMRYQAADIDVAASDWTLGNNTYFRFDTYGMGVNMRLITCTYGGSTYLAIEHTNTHAVSLYFEGTLTNMDLTPVHYYTSNPETVVNSEINDSRAAVSLSQPYSGSYKYALTSDNVASATKLATARTIWGQSFDGTGNVSGALSGVTNINSALYIDSSGQVGIGTTSPAYKLDVAGTGRFTGAVTMSSTLTVAGGVSTPALYGGTSGSYNWRLISDNSTNAIWLQAGLTDNTSNSGVLYLSGLHASLLTFLHLYATETTARTLRPSSNSAYTLGTSSYRWSTIYGTHGNFSASVTASTSVVTPLLQASSGLDIVANGSAAGSRLFLTSNCFRPWGDDSKLIDLGSSSIQWRNLYAVGATFSDSIKVNSVVSPVADGTGSLGSSSLRWGYVLANIGLFGDSVEVRNGITCGSDLNVGGNAIIAGDTSSGSDIRFKDIINDKRIKIEDMAKAPLFTFKWNDRDDGAIHLGSSAQYWENICPWLVTGEDFKSLNYATLGVAMGISLAKHETEQDKEIKALKRKVKDLETKIRRMEYGNR